MAHGIPLSHFARVTILSLYVTSSLETPFHQPILIHHVLSIRV